MFVNENVNVLIMEWLWLEPNAAIIAKTGSSLVLELLESAMKSIGRYENYCNNNVSLCALKA